MAMPRSAVARLINISRNTITAHLRRAGQALGLDLDDVRFRAAVNLALALTRTWADPEPETQHRPPPWTTCCKPIPPAPGPGLSPLTDGTPPPHPAGVAGGELVVEEARAPGEGGVEGRVTLAAEGAVAGPGGALRQGQGRIRRRARPVLTSPEPASAR
ncbi:helix-turn-helix domain-containing protein [Streptomyces sp. NPDC057580]|uniref:helix-turn-helix domain-containing protein n=1 Tax=Streptomyces sp. NPDC057580 TaxID=3346173 RepID=UPI0036C60F0E